MNDIETIAIKHLLPDPANVRLHSKRNVEVIKASLLRFGQQIPLVVDDKNIVRVGNARLQAMQELGWEEARILRTNLTGAEAIAYGIADNRTGDPDVGSTFDYEHLSKILGKLEREDESLAEVTGFTAEEIVAMLEADDDQPTAPADFPSYDETLQTEHQCPKCKFCWSGSSQPQGAA